MSYQARDNPRGRGGGQGRGRGGGRGGGRGAGGGGNRACFKCGEEGHISPNCPQGAEGGGRGRGAGGGGNRACFKCGEEGHISANCPQSSGGVGRGAYPQGGQFRGERQQSSGGYQQRGNFGGGQPQAEPSRGAPFQGGRGGPPRGGGFSTGPPRSDDFPQTVDMPRALKVAQVKRQGLQPGTVAVKTFEVLANFYKLTLSDVIVTHYDINICESLKQKANKQKRMEASTSQESQSEAVNEKAELFIKKFSQQIMDTFMGAHQDIFGPPRRVIYDGYKNLYSVPELTLPREEFTQKVDINGRAKFFRIKVCKVETVDLSHIRQFYDGRVSDIPDRVISMLEIIFKSLILEAGYVPFQRKYFNIESGEKQRPDFKYFDVVRGFLGAIQKTEFGLALNVHLKTSCIISKSYIRLDHLVSDLAGLRSPNELARFELSDRQLRDVNKMIGKLGIFTKHTGRKMGFKVDHLIVLTPRDFRITLDQGKATQRVVTVHDYFREKYSTLEPLKKYPMIRLTKKDTTMPLELCLLEDKQFMSHSKMDADTQAALLPLATHKPNVYFNRANQIVSRTLDGSSGETRRDFGIAELSLQPVSVTARQLPAPMMKGARLNEKLFEPKVPLIYAFVSFDAFNIDEAKLRGFIAEMRKEAMDCGMKLPEARLVKVIAVKNRFEVQKYCEELIEHPQLKNLDMLFFGIPKQSNVYLGRTDEIYELVKTMFDTDYGIITQGVKSDNIRMIKRGYFKNLLLKVNGKFGGQNAVIDPTTMRLGSIGTLNPARTMIVGVDVYHPGPTDTIRSSIAAAIGSYNGQFTKYSASIRVQKKDDTDKDREMIRRMDEMMEELLLAYRKENGGQLPEAVFIFRDGVSEGQLDKLRSIEIPLVQKAITKVIGKKIKLSLIVVQKRHHTRFVRSVADTSGRFPTYNVPRGTVVDNMIVDPTHEEFYLASHDSPLGTTKPTKYIRIRDDLGLSTDNLQKLCFYACHQCIRTRQSISIPTAVRYADLCAYRSSLHIRDSYAQEGIPIVGLEAEELEQAVINKLNKWVKVDEKIQNMLYYS